MQIEAGAVLEGKVTGITRFGAFVALGEGKSGLVHISEIANSYVNDINEHLSVGQTVKVRVLSVSEDGKINLSVKRAADMPKKPAGDTHPWAEQRQPLQDTVQRPEEQSFEDKLKRFMQESDSKIADNKFYADHKQRNRKR